MSLITLLLKIFLALILRFFYKLVKSNFKLMTKKEIYWHKLQCQIFILKTI